MTRIMPVSSVRNNHVMVMRSSAADNMTGEAAYSKKKDNKHIRKKMMTALILRIVLEDLLYQSRLLLK